MYPYLRVLVATALVLNSSLPVFAQTRSRRQSTATTSGIDPKIFEAAAMLTDRITMDKATLITLGVLLKALRTPDPQQIKAMGLYDQVLKPEIPDSISLSSSQVLSMLLKLPQSEHSDLWSTLAELPEEISKEMPKNESVNQATVAKALRVLMKREGSSVVRVAQLFTKIQARPDLWKEIAAVTPEVPFAVNVVGGKVIQPGYDDMRVYVNHTYINPVYLYDSAGKPRKLTDQEFAKICRKISHSEALKGKANSYYVPGTDFAFQCAKDDILKPATNLVAVLRSFINGTGELKDAEPYENAGELAKDLKKMGLEKGAAEEVWFNVFEFNLSEVKDAFIANHKRNMERYFEEKNFEKPVPKLRGGIDLDYVTEKHPRTWAIFKEFQEHAREMVEIYGKARGLPAHVRKQVESSAQVFAVPISGLNHQKIVIRDPSNPETAAVLFLSGNFTNSCLGATGDEAPTPGDLGISGRKRTAIANRNGRMLDELEDAVPNANHAIIVKGFLPAQVTRLELMKFLKPDGKTEGLSPKLGKDDFPGVGNYRLFKDSKGEKYLDISFSMKGGMGAPDRDLLVPLIQQEANRVSRSRTRAMVESIHFVASSKAVNRALLRLSAQSNKVANGYDYSFVGDTPFAMREYSIIQQLSCVTRRLEKREYTAEEKADIKAGKKEPRVPFAPKEFYDMYDPKKFAQDKSDIPKVLLARSRFLFDECPGTTVVPYLGGSGVPLTSAQLNEVRSNLRVAPRAYGEHSSRDKIKYNGKIHHKVLILPHLDLGTIGSSFNISDSANNNHEQLTVVKDRDIVGPIRGAIAFMHLFSPISRASKPAPACLGGKHDGSVYCDAMERTRRLSEADRCSAKSIRSLPTAEEQEERRKECEEDQDGGDEEDTKG